MIRQQAATGEQADVRGRSGRFAEMAALAFTRLETFRFCDLCGLSGFAFSDFRDSVGHVNVNVVILFDL